MNFTKSKTYLKTLEQYILQPLHNQLLLLSGKTLIITGITGMIGGCLADALLLWNSMTHNSIKLVGIGRNSVWAQKRFAYCWEDPCFAFIEHDISKPFCDFPETVDYIIHAASNGDPVNFAKSPVDTLLANVSGTNYLLDYGRKHGLKRFLYVSSGEAYGSPNANMDDFTESYSGPINCSDPRSCYPEGKRAAEVLCQCYISQYKIDAVIVRPCHIFGPTMTKSDSRALSQFFRSAVDGKNIVLKSEGTVERSQCYVMDAVSAILWILFAGDCGTVYNVADPNYQMTIRAFAQKVAEAGNSKIVFEIPEDIEKKGYSKITRSVLDSSRIKNLGWAPKSGTNAIEETITILREINY